MTNFNEAEFWAYLIGELEKNRIDDAKEATEEFIMKKMFEFMTGKVSDKQMDNVYQIISKFSDVGASKDFRDALSDFVGDAVEKLLRKASRMVCILI